MILEKYNKTLRFYSLSLILPWIFWFIAAYLSHLDNQSLSIRISQIMFGILGLISPIFVAFFLISKDPELVNDVKTRFLRIAGFPRIYVMITCLLIFSSIVIAQFISLLFGHDLSQFVISGDPSFSSAIFSPWFILLFAPVAEELAWHSYGTDTLLRKFSLFKTSIIFAIYWVLWHIPLSFIKGYFHSNIIAEGWIYYLNFVFSLFVFVILMNWLYYKTNRNVILTIVFHLTANISNEIFATHPDSKVIQTGLLLLVTIVVLVKEKNLFFSKIQTIPNT